MTQPPDPSIEQPGTSSPPPQAGYYPPAPPVAASAYGQPEPRAVPGTYFDQASGLTLPEGV
jgi:hypothetical protein